MSEKGGYNTRSLKLVERTLRECSGAHLTAEDITSRLRAQGERIGSATVYRNLEKLRLAGKVRKFIGGDSACFSYTDEGCHEHFHLKCSSCGRLIHIECGHIDELSRHIKSEHGFAVDKGKTVLYGLCGECAR